MIVHFVDRTDLEKSLSAAATGIESDAAVGFGAADNKFVKEFTGFLEPKSSAIFFFEFSNIYI